MRGRAWEIPIYPFSFPDVFAHHGREAPARPERLTSRQSAVLDHHFLKYFRRRRIPGGAEPSLLRKRMELLQGYVDVVLLRDVIERHGIVNVVALRQLVRRLLGSPASRSVCRSFSRTSNRSISPPRATRFTRCSITSRMPSFSRRCLSPLIRRSAAM